MSILLFEFASRYVVELVNEIPGDLAGLRHVYFPGASREGGRDGLLLKVSPHEGLPWLGTFAFGYASPLAASVIASCPSENFLAVISSGLGTIVNVNNPLAWEQVKTFPITDVKAVVTRRLLLFTDFTSISAYGDRGYVWTTTRLATDEIKIKEIRQQYVLGSGWNAELQREVEFLVDLDSGSHETVSG